jgi:hypothetical protein
MKLPTKTGLTIDASAPEIRSHTESASTGYNVFFFERTGGPGRPYWNTLAIMLIIRILNFRVIHSW